MPETDFHETMAMATTHLHDSTFIDWHGWQVPNLADVAVHVGSLPGRKSKCLYVNITGGEQHGNYLDVLAYFRNEHYARAALTVLDKFAEAINR